MVFFRNSKKLAQATKEKELLEQEIVKARREREAQDEQQRQARERQRQAQRDLEVQLAQEQAWARQREEEVRRADNERRRKDEEKRQAELERQAAERKILEEKQRKLKEASPETLRILRELIRDRYELDVKIWDLRGARRVNMPIVQRKMDKADAIMDEILMMVHSWGDNSDERWSDGEWEKVQIIQKKLQHGGYRDWAARPVWEDNRT